MAVSDESARLQAELRELGRRVLKLEDQNERLRKQLRTARSNEQRTRSQIAAMRRSFSWRVGYPFRVILRALRRGED